MGQYDGAGNDGRPPRADGRAGQDWQEALEEALRQAARAWPGVDLEPGRYQAYLLDRLPEPSAAALRELHTTDLYLACACAGGDAAGLQRFETEFTAEIAAATVRLAQRGCSADDLHQMLREKLFTAPVGERPKIAGYSGTGRLRNWVRIAALRLGVDAGRRQQARPDRMAVPSRGLAAAVDLGADPELAYMKSHYRAAFLQALQGALRTLSARQRNLLRHSLAHHLSTAQIAALYHVHRATMKRWLAAAREQLLRETRQAMAEQLDLTDQEFDSIMPLLRSQLDVSILRHLQTRSTSSDEQPTRGDELPAAAGRGDHDGQ